MKVYFISGGYDGCFYVRCMLPLVAGGWWGTQTSLRGRKASWEETLKGAMAADVVVFQRPSTMQMFNAAILLKSLGKKIVFDNDDTYKKDSGTPTHVVGMLEEKLKQRIEDLDKLYKEFAHIADLVTVSTEFLAQEYPKEKTIVLPNCVDPLDWDEPLHNETDKVRIGLVGSVIGNQDTEYLKPVLEKIMKRGDVQLVVFGLPPDDGEHTVQREIYAEDLKYWTREGIEWQPNVDIADYMTTLNELRLDMMLIPRVDSYFNRAKSNLKFLEASMCEIPVIAQGFTDGLSPYQGKMDSKFMSICYSNKDWSDCIEAFIYNQGTRQALGKEARQYALNNYNIYENIWRWEEAYKNLLK